MASLGSPWEAGLLYHNYDEKVPYYFTSAIVLIVITVFSAVHFGSKKAVAVPSYGLDKHDEVTARERWMRDAANLVQEGYNRFRGRPFQIWTTEGNQVVLPPSLIEETKMLPDDILTSSLADLLQAKHTSFGAQNSTGHLANVLKHDLNKNIPKLFDGIKEELDVGLSAEFPPCDDWTPATMYTRITRIVARMSGRSFVGPTLNRNEDWINISVNYTRDAFQGAAYLRTWKPILRPIAKYFIPEIWRIWGHNAKTKEFISPILKQRAIAERQEGYQKPVDALQWVRDSLPEGKKDDIYFAVLSTLALGAASIHTTSQLITNVLFDLAARPEYIEPLREEMLMALNASNGKWNQDVMNRLKKMDSFIKESQRVNAVVTSYNRKAIQDVTLSDGTYIPKGTWLFAPSLAVSADPGVYQNSDVFDGFRFFKMREQSAADENKHQFTSTSKTMLHFGAGRHACPGRWFASTQIKMIVITMILKFDIKFKKGQGRPKSILFQQQNMPNPAIELLLKKRDI